MILSHLRIQWISDTKGYGLFAAKKIPKGTMTFIQDPLDIVITPDQFKKQDSTIKNLVDRFSYEGPDGSRIISWDFGKYMNHCCFSNTLTTGYGFEIAIRDIEEGEEVTDDYRIFTTEHQLFMNCEKSNCEGSLNIQNNEGLVSRWDNDVENALKEFLNVRQELLHFMPPKSLKSIENYIKGKEKYLSVRHQLPPSPQQMLKVLQK